MIKRISIFFFLFLCATLTFSQAVEKKDIEITFNKGAQIETGSHYAGVEFHHSFPVPERISFYYPVANSIELSYDYWKRDSSFIGSIGIKEDNNKVEWLNKESLQFRLTPFSVSFTKSDSSKEINISYDFCNDKPALVITIEITNSSDQPHEYSVYTYLETSVKTSHTFALKENTTTFYEDDLQTLFTNHHSKETQEAQVFVSNVGETPIAYSGHSALTEYKEGDDFVINSLLYLDNKVITANGEGLPAARFLYKKKIAPEEKLKIVQLIGSCKQEEGLDLVKYLRNNYKQEISNYKEHVLKEVSKNLRLTGDSVFDKSILWAKSILAVNKHYIDGSVQPMPCPAEYNFYFSHDVMLADLAAVKFDLPRVKQDLSFIISHADTNKIIPHAYYWKDSVFVTEYATPDNWNHFWFVILSANYLRYSSDTVFVKRLYPYIEKSLEQVLQNEKDGVIWAYRPDWWDIGRKYGAKSYMTILAAQSLKEYLYLSKQISENPNKYKYYEELLGKMKYVLNNKFWDNDKKYLIDYYEDGSKDSHYFMGALLAVVYDILDKDKAKELVHTAETKLLDNKIGVYTVYPMDFERLTDFYKFVGNEAGAQYKYLNGGIWPHANAWYCLSLLKIGEKEKAESFLKRTMTLDGIINSPNGQPAMYEYRNSNSNNPAEYGKIDKPQFMWAGAWYLYCIYDLYFNSGLPAQ